MRLFALSFIVALTAMAPTWPVSVNTPTPPPGYAWSANIGKPRPLVLDYRGVGRQFQPGNYDVATQPMGDNWVSPPITAYTTVTLTKPAGISVMPRFPTNEPSCGFVFLVRGPYVDGALNHGDWQVCNLPAGLSRGRAALPVFTHVGSRKDRYAFNGQFWQGNDGGYGLPEVGPSFGARLFNSTERAPVPSCTTGPDVTLYTSIPNVPIYVSIALVDMLGRETECSDPLQIDDLLISDNSHTFAVFRRDTDAPAGTCGYRIYAGYSETDLHRQPVLNYQGSEDKFLWPLFLMSFMLHDVRTDTPAPTPSTTVSSLLNQPQQDVVAGLNTIQQVQRTYDLYCPFILHYDTNNFGREFTGKARYTHKTVYEGQWLETDIPLLHLMNQEDRPKCMTFVSDKAIVGCSTSDWSGGQAMSNTLEQCEFNVSGPETYGFLVDDRSSIYVGSHTASEIRFKDCVFAATNPVKLEGNQTAKIRFSDNCTFYSTGNTRYKADTAAIIYSCTSNDVHVTNIRGVNGEARTLACLASQAGESNVLLTDIFCDYGLPVYATFASNQGGNFTMRDGERINAHGRTWQRYAEAPNAYNANFSVKGVRVMHSGSVVSFLLNQLTTDTDFPVPDKQVPTPEIWAIKGLPLVNQIGFDFSKKKTLRYAEGFNTGTVTIQP